MKKIVFLISFVCLTVTLVAQKAVISFETKVHDFGKLNEEDGKVTYVFEFENKGMTPLVLTKVQASCGCTTPTWSKEPIAPGKKGSVTVTYNPLGRPGFFQKIISVSSNAVDEQVDLMITGEVNAKKANEYNPFMFNFGELQAKAKIIQMSNIEKGKTVVKTLEIKNTSKELMRPNVVNLPPYLTAVFSPETLKPNEEGKVIFSFNSKNCTQWGPVSDDVYFVINAQKKLTDAYKLVVVANVVEDFSRLSLDQKRKSPIMEVPVRSFNLGKLSMGAKRSTKIKISNKGINSLEIRRVINNNPELTVKHSKMTIGSGKSAYLTVDLLANNLTPGTWSRIITLQTNDPENTYMLLELKWVIEK